MKLLEGTCPRNAPLSKYQNKYKNTTIQKYRKQNKNAKLHACSIFFANFTNTKLRAVYFLKTLQIQNYVQYLFLQKLKI